MKFDAQKKKYPAHADEIANIETAIEKGTTSDERYANVVDAFAENLKAAKGKGLGHVLSGAKSVLANLDALQQAIEHGFSE